MLPRGVLSSGSVTQGTVVRIQEARAACLRHHAGHCRMFGGSLLLSVAFRIDSAGTSLPPHTKRGTVVEFLKQLVRLRTSRMPDPPIERLQEGVACRTHEQRPHRSAHIQLQPQRSIGLFHEELACPGYHRGGNESASSWSRKNRIAWSPGLVVYPSARAEMVASCLYHSDGQGRRLGKTSCRARLSACGCCNSSRSSSITTAST